MAQAVREALDEVAEEDVEFRRGVDRDGNAPEALLEALAERLAPDLVSRRLRRSFVEGRRPIRGDAFDQVRALAELDVETPLERRETVIFDLEVDEEQATLSFEGRRRSTCRRGSAPELEFVPRPRGRSGSPTCPGGSTTQDASCWAAGSCARAPPDQPGLTT